MENLKKMTIAEAKERIKNEFCSLMTKEDVLRLLDSLENCCEDENKNGIQKLKDSIVPIVESNSFNPKENTYTTDLVSINTKLIPKGCVEFEVTRYQDIKMIANTIPNLPKGPCKIELFYENREDVRIYINNKIRSIRDNNKPKKRTVFQYFDSPDTTHGNTKKWLMVKNEMNATNKIIDKITVRVCPD